MREIKFRARDENNEWFYFVIDPTDENKELTISFVTDMYRDLKRKGLKNWGQYTGLKDKNGEEIYEGDIVSLADKEFDVLWHPLGRWTLSNYGQLDDFVSFVNLEGELQLEVTGNIYEKK